MFGRALEAICRGKLPPASSGKHLMLGPGLKQLKASGLIDQRLSEWGDQLHFFRNTAAHPNDEVISREDAEDLQAFVYAKVEYIYDLADRYEEFKSRIARRKNAVSIKKTI